MSDRRWPYRLARECEQAGLTVLKTKSGWRVLHPDGETSVGFHETPSDWRAERNTRSRLKRLGLLGQPVRASRNRQEELMSDSTNAVSAPTEVKPFGDIADEQGWTDATRLAVLLDFIEANGYHEPLSSHAQMKADDENAYGSEGVSV